MAKISNRGSMFTARPKSGLKMSRNTGVKAKPSLPESNPYEASDGGSIMKDGTNPFKTLQVSKSSEKMNKSLYSKSTQKYLERLSQPVVTKSPLRMKPGKVDGESAAKSGQTSPVRPRSNYSAMTASKKMKTIENKTPIEKPKLEAVEETRPKVQNRPKTPAKGSQAAAVRKSMVAPKSAAKK